MKRNPHERVVCALFKSREEVHKALDSLAPTGLATEDISVIMNEDVFEEEEFSEIAGVKMHDESIHAAKIGGVAGGVLAGLTAMAGMVVGGAALLAAGPIVAAIAGFGALLGTLIGAGFTEEQAKKNRRGYEKRKDYGSDPFVGSSYRSRSGEDFTGE